MSTQLTAPQLRSCQQAASLWVVALLPLHRDLSSTVRKLTPHSTSLRTMAGQALHTLPWYRGHKGRAAAWALRSSRTMPGGMHSRCQRLSHASHRLQIRPGTSPCQAFGRAHPRTIAPHPPPGTTPGDHSSPVQPPLLACSSSSKEDGPTMIQRPRARRHGGRAGQPAMAVMLEAMPRLLLLPPCLSYCSI